MYTQHAYMCVYVRIVPMSLCHSCHMRSWTHRTVHAYMCCLHACTLGTCVCVSVCMDSYTYECAYIFICLRMYLVLRVLAFICSGSGGARFMHRRGLRCTRHFEPSWCVHTFIFACVRGGERDNLCMHVCVCLYVSMYIGLWRPRRRTRCVEPRYCVLYSCISMWVSLCVCVCMHVCEREREHVYAHSCFFVSCTNHEHVENTTTWHQELAYMHARSRVCISISLGTCRDYTHANAYTCILSVYRYKCIQTYQDAYARTHTCSGEIIYGIRHSSSSSICEGAFQSKFMEIMHVSWFHLQTRQMWAHMQYVCTYIHAYISVIFALATYAQSWQMENIYASAHVWLHHIYVGAARGQVRCVYLHVIIDCMYITK